MPPVDSTPDHNSGNFELIYCVKAFNKIPVYEFKSKLTGLTVVIAEIEGPVVEGFFCLATEAFDDDGLPHTLEHLIFLGSEQYPYKGVLDLLANRCLASGTNAWTDVDHTCYTVETAGYEGFLSLMPVYIDHILYPVISDKAFITEVHHITGSGEDAGVVYCEVQGCENVAESRVHLTMQRNMYPGHCGYSSETGGLMKNLRESTTHEKIVNYHKEFYRPENLKLIITGQIKPDEVFKALEPVENNILSKGTKSPFTRPWQSPCPPFEKSKDLVIKYPSDDESNGMVTVSWRGPSATKDLYILSGCSILLKYLTDGPVSPLQKEFVEISDPLASQVSYNLYENSEACLYLMFKSVPKEKLSEVKPKLDEILKKIAENQQIDLNRLKTIINRQRREYLSNLESSPHSSVAHLIIGHMLYGTTKEDLYQRINPLEDLNKLDHEPQSFWIELLTKWFINNNVLSIQGIPSNEEQQRLAFEEKARIEAQIAELGEAGLAKKEEELYQAIEFNERPPPDDMLVCVPIPSIQSINFHEVIRHSSGSNCQSRINLTKAPIFTYFDDLKSSFVYMIVLMNTSYVDTELRPYIPLLLDALFESSIERDGVLISHQDVIVELQEDTVSIGKQIGLSGLDSKRFTCGMYSQTVAIVLQVEPEKFQKGMAWMRELLYQTKFTAERLKIIAAKMINDVAHAKRSGRSMVNYCTKGLWYIPDSNQKCNGVLAQSKFLNHLISKLDESSAVIEALERVRLIITQPCFMALYLAANLDDLQKDNPSKIIQDFLLPANVIPQQKSLIITPDWRLQLPRDEGNLRHCLISMGCLESSEFEQSTPCITSYDDPDMPAILVYAQYLTQTEGPLWKKIRGKGFSYNYTMVVKPHEGLLYLIFSRATNVVGAYKEAHEIVTKQITTKTWDNMLIESAKSSLLFEFIENEESIGNVVLHSLQTYFFDVNYEYNRTLLRLINEVEIEHLNRVGDRYFAPLFDPKQCKTALVCDPSKAEEIAEGFKQFSIEFTVFPSLEESFLNK